MKIMIHPSSSLELSWKHSYEADALGQTKLQPKDNHGKTMVSARRQIH